MTTTALVLILLSILVTLLSLLSSIRSDVWWIRIWDFPRLQVLCATFLLLTAVVYFADAVGPLTPALAAVLLLGALYQAYMIYPYTALARAQVLRSRDKRPGERVRLLFANVLMTNRNSARLIEIIRAIDPDIIMAAETDEWWAGELAGLEASHRYSVIYPLGNTYGMVLYSRLELVDAEVKFLVEDDIPSIHATVRLPGGSTFELRCLHPRPPFPTEDASATARDAELLIVGRESKIKSEPFVVMGDLNDVAWSRTNYLFQDISGLLDPRVGRGFYNTFHAKLPLVRFPLDHFFVSSHFRLARFTRLPYFGSDHFPVFIELSFEPDAIAEQPPLSAEPDQIVEAFEKIDKARAA
ncbi:MAG: endonuclease/exonuclease/phosphatase family protein [Pyrinomonadaceae bacterium]